VNDREFDHCLEYLPPELGETVEERLGDKRARARPSSEEILKELKNIATIIKRPYQMNMVDEALRRLGQNDI
jgi:hypothetical protein